MDNRQQDLFTREPDEDLDDPAILPDLLIVHPRTVQKYADINTVHTIDRKGTIRDLKDLKVPAEAVLVGDVGRYTYRCPACCVSSAIAQGQLARVGIVLLRPWTEEVPAKPDHESCPLALRTRLHRWGQHVKCPADTAPHRDWRCMQQVTLYPGDRCYPWELDVEDSRWAFQWVQDKAELYYVDSASHFRGIAFPSYYRAYGDVEGPSRGLCVPPSIEEVEMLLS